MTSPNDLTPQTKAKLARPKTVAHESQTLENRLIEAINLEILSRENMRLKASQSVPQVPSLGNPKAAYQGTSLDAPKVAPQAVSQPAKDTWPEEPGAGDPGSDDPGSDDPGPDAFSGGLPWEFPDAATAPATEPRLAPNEMVRVENLAKTFILHLSGPAVLKALEGVSLSLSRGKCLALTGPSGAGKSSLLRCLYGNYQITSGEILIRDGETIVALNQATPREVMDLRLRAMSYVSQFLRVIPRVSALEVVAEPLTARGFPESQAKERASDLLSRLHVPKRLQALPPATFSGGERQRVNIARGLIWPSPILLLDEPTASLDVANKKVVIDLINEAKARGTAIIGVFHDRDALAAVSDKAYRMSPIKDNGFSRSPRGTGEV